MTVDNVVKRDMQTCRPETDLSTVAMQMRQVDCGVVPVVASSGEVVGMITDRDICMAVAIKHCDPASIRVSEVISGNVYACSPDADAHTAFSITRQKHARRLPVVTAEERKLVGILSINDVELLPEPGLL